MSKHFYFPVFSDASAAMNAWWDHQDIKMMPRTSFNTSAEGSRTDVSVHPRSIGDESKVIEFFQANFAGKFTIHETQQVRTWLDGVFG